MQPTLVGLLLLFSAIVPELRASSSDAWEGFQATVRDSGLSQVADFIEGAEIAVDPYGTDSYGVALAHGISSGSGEPVLMVTIFDKTTKNAETSNAFLLHDLYLVRALLEENQRLRNRLEAQGTYTSPGAVEVGREGEPRTFFGAVKSYEDMGYPRYMFVLEDETGATREFYFNVTDYPSVEAAFGTGFVDQIMYVTVADMGRPRLYQVTFPGDSAVYMYRERLPDGVDATELLERRGIYVGEIEENYDIYRLFTAISFGGMRVEFDEDVAGVDAARSSHPVDVLYFMETREETVGVVLEDAPSHNHRSPFVEDPLPVFPYDVPHPLAQELFREVMADMAPDETVMMAFRETPQALFDGVAMDLNTDGRNELVITPSRERHWCTSHNCPVWIYAIDQGQYRRLLSGFHSDYLTTSDRQEGYAAFVTVEEASHVSQVYTEFVFTGKAYRQGRCFTQIWEHGATGEGRFTYEPCP
ncbi:MAG: hypothetical protein GKR89_04150 [Candidatus Latescibacteria bacterium]|nr:hypothetical protein [Candidatus Latescibacterota bacterium]